jgi:uncharacterized protein involved in tolerance to divalent cations
VADRPEILLPSYHFPNFLSHPGQHSLVKLLMRASCQSASHVHARCLWAATGRPEPALLVSGLKACLSIAASLSSNLVWQATYFTSQLARMLLKSILPKDRHVYKVAALTAADIKSALMVYLGKHRKVCNKISDCLHNCISSTYSL